MILDYSKSYIKKILKEAPNGTTGILLGVDKTGCSGYGYKIEFANEINTKGYEYVDKFGIKVFIEPKSTMQLLGSEMDYEISKTSARFIFNNPNAKNTCGCGESFNI